MTKVSEHFSWNEFKCKNGQEVPDNLVHNAVALATALERIREEVKQPLTLSSVYRAPEYNTLIGGAKRSQHLECKAADIVSDNPEKLYGIIKGLIKSGNIPQGGLGKYKTFVHYDIRGYKARW